MESPEQHHTLLFVEFSLSESMASMGDDMVVVQRVQSLKQGASQMCASYEFAPKSSTFGDGPNTVSETPSSLSFFALTEFRERTQ